MEYIGYIASVFITIALVIYMQELLHIFQLNDYKIPLLNQHISENNVLKTIRFKINALGLLIGCLFSILIWVFIYFASGNTFFYISMGAWHLIVLGVISIGFCAFSLIIFIKGKKTSDTQKVKLNGRMLKLISIISFIVLVLISIFITIYLFIPPLIISNLRMDIVKIYVICGSIIFLSTAIVSMIIWSSLIIKLGILLTGPLDKVISKHHLISAKKRLKKYANIKSIAIAGNGGKTDTKIMLESLLKETYKTAVTPPDCNTKEKIAGFITKHITGDEDIFITDMNEDYAGDIKEMCELISPKMGIITNIDPDMLNNFEDIDSLKWTIYELMDYLKDEGIGFFIQDNDISKDLYEYHKGEKFLYGIEGEDLYVSAENIVIGESDSAFELLYDGEKIECKTKLLSQENINNLLGCIAVAKYLGVEKDEILDKIKAIDEAIKVSIPEQAVDDVTESDSP